MFSTKKLFVIFCRKYSIDHHHHSALITALTTQTMCSAENKAKCIEKMELATKHATLKLPSTTQFAAVLIPIVQTTENGKEPSILYTLRSNKMRKHIRQVSFPGGIRDLSDASYIDCALRETDEEIGISRSNITIWGETNLIYPQNAPAIMPVVGSIKNYRPDELKLNLNEVERVFTVPISQLCKSKRHTQFRMAKRSGVGYSGYSVPVFSTSDIRIWGITALITNLFLHSLLPNDVYQSEIEFISKYKS